MFQVLKQAKPPRVGSRAVRFALPFHRWVRRHSTMKNSRDSGAGDVLDSVMMKGCRARRDAQNALIQLR